MEVRYLILMLFLVEKPCCISARFQWTPWSPPSECSKTCGRGISTKIRECKPVDESSSEEGENDCRGPATIEEECFMPPCPKLDGSVDCNCGCKMTEDNGRIISKLYAKESFCQWSIHTKPGSSIVLTVNRVKNFDWTSSGLYISGKERAHSFTEQHGGKMDRSFPIVIYTRGNSVNVTLHYFKIPLGSKYVELEASYTLDKAEKMIEEKDNEDEDNGSMLNIPAIAGISACAFVIILASIIVTYRKIRNSSMSDNKEEEKAEEGFEDNCSSISGSNRSAQRNPKSGCNLNGKACYSTPYSTGTLSTEERERLLTTQNNELYLQKEGSIMSGIPPAGFIPAGQGYVNWPVQHGQIIQPTVQMYPGQSPVAIQQIPQQALDYMIKQTQLNYARQMSYDPSNAGSYEYVTSGGEG